MIIFCLLERRYSLYLKILERIVVEHLVRGQWSKLSLADSRATFGRKKATALYYFENEEICTLHLTKLLTKLLSQNEKQTKITRVWRQNWR